jgi:type VI protein secretion system component Hcp
MATIIKPKRSGTASSVPTTSDLADGEIAVNSADQKIYIRSSSSIINLGTGTTASATELNILDGATISTAELNASASTGKSIAMSIVFGSG